MLLGEYEGENIFEQQDHKDHNTLKYLNNMKQIEKNMC